MGNLAEGRFADPVPMIGDPTPNERIELHNQASGWNLGIGLDETTDFSQKGLDVLLGRLDEQFTLVFTDVVSQKVKAIVDVHDFGFCH